MAEAGGIAGWAGAFAGSVALHAGLAAALFAAVPLIPQKAPETQISILGPDTGDGQTEVAAAAPLAVERAAPVEQTEPATSAPSGESVAPLLPRDAEPASPVAAEQPDASTPERLAAAVSPSEPLAASRDAIRPTQQERAAAAAEPLTAERAPGVAASSEAEIVRPEVPGSAPVPQPAEALSPAPSEALPASPQPGSASTPDVAESVSPPAQANVASVPTAPAEVPVVRAQAEPSAAAPLRESAPTLTPRANQAAPAERVAALPPVRPEAPVVRPEPSADEIARRRAVDFLQRFPGGDCFLALPETISAGAPVRLRGFGADPALLKRFEAASADAIDASTSDALATVGEAQCLALAFARQLPRYPLFGLGLSLDTSLVTSGAMMSGAVLDADRPHLHLLLVDDEGNVQTIDRFLEPLEEGIRRFGAPMVLTNDPKTPTQLVIAVASDRPIEMLEQAGPLPAREFFPALARAVADGKIDLDFAIADFALTR